MQSEGSTIAEYDSYVYFGRSRSMENDRYDELIRKSETALQDVFRSITKIGKSKKETEFDMYGEERELWEKSVLSRTIDFSYIPLDPTPFQVQESTSLFKVHSLFSLLGLKRAYVTKDGQLVGVISLLDLRNTTESVQSGKTPTRREGECQPEKSTDLIGDDVDYLHPQLEVLTRPNTCGEISDIFDGSQESLKPNPPPAPAVEVNVQRGLSVSISAPNLSHEEITENTNSSKPTSAKFTLENQSTVSSIESQKDDTSNVSSKKSDHQRRSTEMMFESSCLTTKNRSPDENGRSMITDATIIRGLKPISQAD